MTSEINFEGQNEFMRWARANEHSKHLLRPGDVKFLPSGGSGVIISGSALMVYKDVRAGPVGAATEEAKVKLKYHLCYVRELKFNLKPIGNHWWV